MGCGFWGRCSALLGGPSDGGAGSWGFGHCTAKPVTGRMPNHSFLLTFRPFVSLLPCGTHSKNSIFTFWPPVRSSAPPRKTLCHIFVLPLPRDPKTQPARPAPPFNPAQSAGQHPATFAGLKQPVESGAPAGVLQVRPCVTVRQGKDSKPTSPSTPPGSACIPPGAGHCNAAVQECLRLAGLLRHCCVLHRHKPSQQRRCGGCLPGEFLQPGRRQLPAGMVS